MSESVATALEPVAPSVSTPGSGAAPGPTTGTTPPGAETTGVAVPAGDSLPAAAEAPKPVEAKPAELVKETSLLSEAKAEETAPEAKPEQPEVKAEKPLPKYDAYKLPDGVKLGEEQVSTFNGLLGEYETRIATTPTEAHAATQELGQKMIDLYVKETAEAGQRWAAFSNQNWQRLQDEQVSAFKSDPDIGGNRELTTLKRAGQVIDVYASSVGAERANALRNQMAATGIGNNVEMIRFVNWIADYATEQGKMVAAPPRPLSVAASKAARLYRNSGAA